MPLEFEIDNFPFMPAMYSSRTTGHQLRNLHRLQVSGEKMTAAAVNPNRHGRHRLVGADDDRRTSHRRSANNSLSSKGDNDEL